MPDRNGFSGAVDIRSEGFSVETLQTLATNFTRSSEFTNRYGTGTAIDAAYVNTLYQNVLGRDGTQTEIARYTSGASGFTTRVQVLYAFAQSTEFQNRSTVAAGVYLTQVALGVSSFTGPLLSPTGFQDYTDSPDRDYLRGGDGGDTFDLSAGGFDIIVQNPGDSAPYTGAAGATTITGAFDIITGADANDRIAVTSTDPDFRMPYQAAGPIATSVVAASAIGDNTYQLIRGTLTAGAAGAPSTFTPGAIGSDTMIIYDANSAVGATAVEALVLVNYQRGIAAYTNAQVIRGNLDLSDDSQAGVLNAMFFRVL